MIIHSIPNKEGNEQIYISILQLLCGDTSNSSMVDLMCHKAPYTPKLGFKERVYVDIQNRALDYPEEQQYFVNKDVFEFLSGPCKLFDVAICSDGLEHLTEERGRSFLTLMKMRSRKQIIFTPLGSYAVADPPTENPDEHKSGWTPDMLAWPLAIVLPDFHPQLKCGAWFGINCDYPELIRISSLLNTIK